MTHKSGQVVRVPTQQTELLSGKMHLISLLKGSLRKVVQSNESYGWTIETEIIVNSTK